MRNLVCIAILILFNIGCEKDEFDIDNPDVKKFVQQIKNGTYSCYEKGEKGENLWLIMPEFREKHVQSLIDFSKDTSHITDFPFNPISSRTPFPYRRDYCILGECLLWTVEGIRNGSGFGSLDPYMIDTTLIESERYKGIGGAEILIVRDVYKNWWKNFKDKDWKNKNPLKETSYRWF
jgi:hypothetical protein